MWGYGKDIIRGFSLVTAIYGPIAKVKEIVKTASSNEILEKFYRAMSQKEEYNTINLLRREESLLEKKVKVTLI